MCLSLFLTLCGCQSADWANVRGKERKGTETRRSEEDKWTQGDKSKHCQSIFSLSLLVQSGGGDVDGDGGSGRAAAAGASHAWSSALHRNVDFIIIVAVQAAKAEAKVAC